MAFGSFVKRLLGGSDTVTVSDDPFGSRKTLPNTVAPPPEPPKREADVMVQREEIIDGRSRIAGYRFVARRLGGGAPPPAPAAVAALCKDNLAAFAERRLALISLTAKDWQAADFRQLVAPHTTFLLASPARDEQDAWRLARDEIKAGGGRIALDSGSADDDAALAHADLLLLDFPAYSLEAFERLVKSLAASRPQLPLLADGIGSWTEHRLCQSMGVRYSLGGFAATADEEDKGEKLNQSRLVLIEMLNLLRREADAAEIAAVAKRDPGVAVKVVGMANSPLSGLSAPVASLEQALLVLGRATLYRWLSLAMFRSGNGGGRDEALLELALYRARFLELLATGSRPKAECDELFLVGLLSLLDSLLGMPMAQVVNRMHLPAAVADVLLRNEGPYGRFLMLALVMEKDYGDRAARIAAELGIEPDRLDECSTRARAWAEEALLAG